MTPAEGVAGVAGVARHTLGSRARAPKSPRTLIPQQPLYSSYLREIAKSRVWRATPATPSATRRRRPRCPVQTCCPRRRGAR
jgi:hypothetical protein